MANMQRIADMAGVSLGTVSNVLNDTAVVREPAAQILFERFSGNTNPPRHTVLETELTVRASIAPPQTEVQKKKQPST